MEKQTVRAEVVSVPGGIHAGRTPEVARGCGWTGACRAVYYMGQRGTAPDLRDIDREAKKAEFGIFIGEEEWLGRGIGEEAAKLILDYGFEELGLHKIKLRVLADNKRAIASYRKAGFVEEGCFRDELLLDGKYCDLIFMAKFHCKKNDKKI